MGLPYNRQALQLHVAVASAVKSKDLHLQPSAAVSRKAFSPDGEGEEPGHTYRRIPMQYGTCDVRAEAFKEFIPDIFLTEGFNKPCQAFEV